MKFGFGLVAICAVALSCGTESATGEARRGTLAPGTAAKVGSELVSVETIERIARAENISAEAARERAISDAAFAFGARSTLHEAAVTNAERAGLARALLASVADRTAGFGPPNDDEIARLSAERWPEFDRPPAARTTHAVVLVQKPEEQAAARELAARIGEAVRHAADAREFSERAEAVPRGALTVRVQPLPPVTLDGRTFQVEGSPAPSAEPFDPEFARAALALETPGQISPVIRSEHGFHVIMLEERLAPKIVPIEERRRLLAGEVERRRAEAARKELLARVTAATPIEINRSADELTARVPVSP